MKIGLPPLLLWAVLAAPLSAQAALKVAVLDVDLFPAGDPSMVAQVTESIVAGLSQSRKYQIIYRPNAEQGFGEKELRLFPGLQKVEEVQRLGEYLGADLVVVAQAWLDYCEVKAEMIDVVTGAIIARVIEIPGPSAAEEVIRVLLDSALLVGRRLAVAADDVAVEIESGIAFVEEGAAITAAATDIRGASSTEEAVHVESAGATAEEAVEIQRPSQQAPWTDCESAFQLGKTDAVYGARGRWLPVAFGFVSTAAGGIWGLVEGIDAEVGERTPLYLLAGLGIGLATASLSASVLTPAPSWLPDPHAVDTECYRRGYMRTLRGSNAGKAVLGGLLAAGTGALGAASLEAAVVVVGGPILAWLVLSITTSILDQL